jgi:hypothetical protein
MYSDSSAISSSGEGSDYDPDEIGSDMDTGSSKKKREKKPKKAKVRFVTTVNSSLEGADFLTNVCSVIVTVEEEQGQ